MLDVNRFYHQSLVMSVSHQMITTKIQRWNDCKPMLDVVAIKEEKVHDWLKIVSTCIEKLLKSKEDSRSKVILFTSAP